MNIYWILFGIGWALVLGTRFFMLPVVEHEEHLDDKPTWLLFIFTVLMCICIVMVGGIANGLWIGSCMAHAVAMNFWEKMFAAGFIGFIPAGLTYAVGYAVLGLYHVKNKFIHTIFVVVFIASIVFWTIPITKYYQNFEVEKQTNVSSTVENDLYYFCNIPVQKISGSVEGSFNSSIFGGSGKVSGEISTDDTLPYWYDSGNGDALFNSVNANDSKIVFTEEGETPFVRVITYCTKEVQINNNTGEQTILNENWWKVYEFHVPSEIMQYNIG